VTGISETIIYNNYSQTGLVTNMQKGVDLDDIFDRFLKPKTPIFKERDALRATYIPDFLPHRDREIQQLANILGPIMAGDIPSNAFLYGKPGSGKTVVTKYVIKHLHEKAADAGIKFEYSFINCQMIDTPYRVYATLCDTVAVDTEIATTGLSTDEIFNKFSEKLEELDLHLTIILDEVDLLLKKASKSLYGLTRINTDLLNSKVSIIGITNNVSFKEQIDARIRSTLTEQEIVFSPYTATQLRDILEERSRIGFYDDVVTSSAIERASGIAASEHGDARRALDLLRVAGEVAETNQEQKVTADHVKKASTVIETDTVKEVLITLPIHAKVVLLAIALLDHERSSPKHDLPTTGDVYKLYYDLCKQLVLDDLTQRRVGDLINELDVLGMIRANVVSKGRHGRTRIIRLAVQALEIHRALEKDPRIFEILPNPEFWLTNQP